MVTLILFNLIYLIVIAICYPVHEICYPVHEMETVHGLNEKLTAS